MTYYFIIIDNQQVGPLSLEELKKHNLRSTTLVWKEGQKDWTNASEFKELNEMLIKPPPIPHYSEATTNVSNENKTRKVVAKEILTINALLRQSLLIVIAISPVIFTLLGGFNHITMYYKWQDAKLQAPSKKGDFLRVPIDLMKDAGANNVKITPGDPNGARSMMLYKHTKGIEKDILDAVLYSLALGLVYFLARQGIRLYSNTIDWAEKA